METKSKPYKPNPTRGWPPERRRAQAARIRRQKPWLKATGPRTAVGKARVAQNALKHGRRSAAFLRQYRAISRLLRFQKQRLHKPNTPPPSLFELETQNGDSVKKPVFTPSRCPPGLHSTLKK